MARVKFIIIISLFTITTWGQNVTFLAEAPKVVRQGQQFMLRYVANENIIDIELPEVNGLTLLGGPSTSTSQSIQIINGKTERKVEISYSYYVRIDQPGVLEIPAARAKIGKKWYTSNTLRVEALGQGGSSNQSGGGNNSQASTSGPELFIKAIPSKRNPYIGEPITVELKVFTKVSLAGIDPTFEEADFQGFYKERLETDPITQLTPEKYNNDIYHTAVIARYLVIPQKTGEVKINSFKQNIELRQKSQQRRSNSPFDDFFRSPYQNVRVNYSSNPVTINVKPLPDGAPESFAGAVGNYQLNADMEGDNITTNDAVSVKLSVSGTGNLKLVNQLPLRIPPTFESLEPQVNTSIKTGKNGYTGTKRFTYTLIPRSAGQFTLPPLEFTYFQPSSGTYKTLTTPEYKINVAKGDGSDNVTIVSGLSKEEVKFIGEDIRFIKTNQPFFIATNSFLISNANIKWMYFLPLLLTVLFVVFKFKQIKENSNLAKVKNKKAGKLAQKRLKQAKNCLVNNDKEHFYDEILKALSGYLCDKLAIDMSEFSKEKAIELLEFKNAPEELITDISEIIEQSGYARYAPSAVSDNMDDMYQKTRKAIINLENKLK
jgi:hypothetical protein